MQLSVFVGVDQQESRGYVISRNKYPTKSQVVVEWVSGLIVRAGLLRSFDVFFD